MNDYPMMASPEAPTLPHSMTAEESVIGAVLIDAEWLAMVALQSDAFYIYRHRFIWSAILSVRDRGMAVDYTTVCAELDQRGQLAEIGGAGALYDLMARSTGLDNIDSHAEVIRQMATRRRYIDLAGTIAKQAMNGGVDEAAAIEVLTSHSKGNRDGRHIAEGLTDLEIAIIERMNNPLEVWGIPFGFKDLDKRTGGMQKEQVFLLSGESGTGKTTIMLQAALSAAKAGHGVAIFEKEMSEARTLRRLIEIDCGVPNRAMLSGLSAEQLTAFKAAKARLKRLPIYINDDPVSTTADLRGVIARARTKMPIDAAYLDYLGLLGDMAPGNQNDYDQTKAMRFREMCREMVVAGFAIQDMVKAEGAPRLQNMSGGAKVRFGADVVYFIVQDTDNPHLHYLTPAKERDGDSDKKPVALMRPGLAFVDATARIDNLNYVT